MVQYLRADMAESDDDSVSQPERYPFYEGDRFSVDEITHIIRTHTSLMSPSELRSAATVLLALKRMPYVTHGVDVNFSFLAPNVHGTHRQADIEINEEGFRLGLVEYFYDPAVGGDTEARYIFETMAGTSLRRGSIEDWLVYAESFSNSGLLSVEDFSDYDAIDWFSDDGIEGWNKG
jgi:hypothetical protein